jgi:hypothetical protein
MKHPLRTLTLSDEKRVLGGLVAQPFVAAAVAFVAFPLLLLEPDGQTLPGGVPSDVSDVALSVALSAGIVAAVVAPLVVFPAAVWLMKRRELSLAETLMFGIGFGNLPYILLAIVAGGTYGLAGLLRGVLFASLLGMAGAASFWVIAIRPQKFGSGSTAG